MFKIWFGTAAAGALMLAASAAMAGPLLPASTSTFTLTEQFPQVTNYTNAILPVDSFRNDTDGFGDDIQGFTASNFNEEDGPGVGVTDIAAGSGEISLKYWYEIGGPNGANVNIDVTGMVEAFGFPFPDPGTAWAGVSGSIGTPPSGFYAQACASFEAPGCPVGANFGETNFSTEINVPTNTFEWIFLDVRADGQDYGSEFNAQADPIISIDPSVSDPQDFQILVSPDVMNGSPPTVPEPATWAMLLVGFSGLGAALRTARGRRREAASAA
jgi:hypothetical protein